MNQLMKRIIIFILFYLITLSCWSEIYIYGTVTREYKKTVQNSVPASGIILEIYNENRSNNMTIVTDPNGKFVISKLPGNGGMGKYILQYKRNDNSFSTININVDSPFLRLDIFIDESDRITRINYSEENLKFEMDETKTVIIKRAPEDILRKEKVNEYIKKDIINFSNK